MKFYFSIFLGIAIVYTKVYTVNDIPRSMGFGILTARTGFEIDPQHAHHGEVMTGLQT